MEVSLISNPIIYYLRSSLYRDAMRAVLGLKSSAVMPNTVSGFRSANALFNSLALQAQSAIAMRANSNPENGRT